MALVGFYGELEHLLPAFLICLELVECVVGLLVPGIIGDRVTFMSWLFSYAPTPQKNIRFWFEPWLAIFVQAISKALHLSLTKLNIAVLLDLLQLAWIDIN